MQPSDRTIIPDPVLDRDEPVLAAAEDELRESARRRHLLGRGLPTTAVGLILLLAAMYVVTTWSTLNRTALAALGAGLLTYGLQRLGMWKWGPKFQIGLVYSMIWLVVVVMLAVFAGVLPIDGIDDPVTQQRLERPALTFDEPLGRDDFGRSLLSRTVYGARVSLTVGVVAAGVGMIIGCAAGLVAGYYRGKLDVVISIIVNATLAFPPLILLLAIVSVFEKTVTNLSLGLAILSIPTFTRLARAQTLVYAQREFVLAARSMGAKNSRIILREILPNLLLPVVSYAFLVVAVMIVAEGSLSYIGLGIQPPQPSWGGMIAKSQSLLKAHPHTVFVPAAAMFGTVLSLNRVGEWARRAVSGRESKL